MQNKKPIYLSIIIPAYNEGARLGSCLESWMMYLDSTPWLYEIIVVTNGCTDDTVRVCEKYRNDHHEHISFYELTGRGKGRAVKTGMLMAHGKYRYMADADLSTPPSAVPFFMEQCRKGFPVVVGSRETSESVTATTFKRHLIGRVFHFLIRTIVPEIYVRDTQCGFKLFTDEAAGAIFRKTHIDGLAFDVEMLYLAFRLKFPVHELGVLWTHNPDSRVSLLRDSWLMFTDLVKVRGLHKRVGQSSRTPSPEELPA
jgi:dolichyl-phosphate beta-glucosyltransferase